MTIFILVYNLTNGGAERVASLWARGFAEKGHNVCLIIGDDKSPITYPVPDNVRILSIASYKSFAAIRYLDRLCKLRKMVKSENPDVIIGILGRALWAKMVTIDRKTIVINTEHNSFERPDSAPMPKKVWFDKFVVNKLYDRVTVLTQADQDFIGTRLNNTSVLPNPLAFLPCEETDIKNKQKIVLAAGRLNAWHVKGFDNLIKAWSTVGDEKEGWKLRIIGGGKETDLNYLKNLANECNVQDSVEFAGFIADPVPEYHRASVFILSSRYEGFGMVLIEAMSQGCACIACDYKGRQAEIITNKDEGILCPSDDYKSLGESIKKVLKDAELREKLQHGGINRSGYYSVANTAERWLKIIDELK